MDQGPPKLDGGGEHEGYPVGGGQEVSTQPKVRATRWMLGRGGLAPYISTNMWNAHKRSKPVCSFFLLAQFIVYTKVPIWVGSSKKGVTSLRSQVEGKCIPLVDTS